MINEGKFHLGGEIRFLTAKKESAGISFLEDPDELLFETKTINIPEDAVVYDLLIISTTNPDDFMKQYDYINQIYANEIKFVGTEWNENSVEFNHNEKYW